MQKNCKRCGASFECQEDTTCWCFDEQKLDEKSIEFDDCVCKNCLLSQYRKKLLGV
ncbi:MAG: cysteine-rich CWC family protein [Thermoproteota archaeon]